MKTYLLLFLFLTSMNYGACPAMQKSYKYKVDDKSFKTYSDVRKYIIGLKLKAKDDYWRKLNVIKISSYVYKTEWEYDKNDHGFFCVCRDCRGHQMANL